jgi:hypothetical protein
MLEASNSKALLLAAWVNTTSYRLIVSGAWFNIETNTEYFFFQKGVALPDFTHLSALAPVVGISGT